MEVRLLGTGDAIGTPKVGCSCAQCREGLETVGAAGDERDGGALGGEGAGGGRADPARGARDQGDGSGESTHALTLAAFAPGRARGGAGEPGVR